MHNEAKNTELRKNESRSDTLKSNETNNENLPQPEIWLEEYGNQLYRFAYSKLKNEETAEDMLQETLLSAVKAFDSFQAKASVKTWLFTILKNKIIDHVRKTKRRISEDKAIDITDDKFPFNNVGIWNSYIPNWARNPDEILSDKDFADTLESCVRKLKSRPKQALLLTLNSDYSSDEICNALDITSSNLWVILHRARIQLRECLEVNWYKKEN